MLWNNMTCNNIGSGINHDVVILNLILSLLFVASVTIVNRSVVQLVLFKVEFIFFSLLDLQSKYTSFHDY